MSEEKFKTRKQYIIDKKFQLKTTFSVIGAVTIITALVIAAIGAIVTYNNKRINNIHKIQDNVVHFLTSRPHGVEDATYKNAIKDIAQNHEKNIKSLKDIVEYNNALVILMIFFIILQGIILYTLLIKKTHRISGPIYVMTNYMNEILNGNKPDFRPLRQKDELKEFYKLFQEIINKLYK